MGVEVDPASLPPELFRHEDDLSRVIAHVLDRVEERAEAVGAAMLDGPRRGERLLVEERDPPTAARHHRGQALGQPALSHRPVGGELERAPARVGFAAEPGQHPLRQVAADVQDEVAHAVAGPVGPPPYLRLVEPLEAEADLAEVLPEVARAQLAHPRGLASHRPRP